MKQIIYVDILVIVNLFVNYFLLLATAKFFCIKWKTSRLILGEILGGIYSLYILAPELPWFISSVIKLFMSVTIIAATFGIKKPTQFFKILIYFYSVNFLFSGIMMAVWCWFKPNGMQVNNGVVYFNISPVILIISTIISYIIIEAINKIVNKRRLDHKIINLKIKFRTNQISITAKIDTGNFLKEPEFKKGETSPNLVQVIVQKFYSHNGNPPRILEDTLIIAVQKMKVQKWVNKTSIHHLGDYEIEAILDIEQMEMNAALAYNSEQYDKAYQIYQSIINRYPTEGNSYYRMAVMLYKKEYKNVEKKERERLILEYLDKAIKHGSLSISKCADYMKYWITY